jgi:hypothetical protein
MGMFDWISIDKSALPIVPVLEVQGISHLLGKFQTKDLDKCLQNYKIENSILYREVVTTEFDANPVEETELGKRWNPPFIVREISREWVKDDFTGTINIYDSIVDTKTDDSFWVEFEIVLVYGELKSIVLDEIKIEYGQEVRARKEKWEKIWKKRDKDIIYRLCTFISRDIISRLISILNKFDSWVRSYQPE